MPIEAATYISTLDASNPPSTDLLAEGDDHLRLLKSVLKASFPNITGPMTATQAILNGLDARVTSVQTQVDLADNGASIVPVSGILEQAEPINNVTSVGYTILTGDRSKLITRSNAAAMGDTLPQAGVSFPAGWFCAVENIHASNAVTITATISTINGASTLVVYPGYRAIISSDGTNYRASLVPASTGAQTRRMALAGAYTILPTDVRPLTIFDYTTAGFTISTNVAASNFTAQIVVIRNSATTGVVTFDPTSTETVDGAATLSINAGETWWLISDGTNWKSLSVMGRLLHSGAVASKTASYTALLTDKGKSIRFDGLTADVTLTLPSAASCGDGFLLFVSNEDTNDTTGWGVIIDPNSTELLDGFSTRKMYTGSRLTLLCDGTGWRTVGGYYRYFSGDQTITAANGLTGPLAHGLGVRPRRVWAEIKCTTAEQNWAVGDVVAIQYDYSTAGWGPNALYFDATSLNIRGGDGGLASIIIPNKTLGSHFTITAANWRVRVYAEA